MPFVQKEDIKNADGDVLVKAHTIIEQKATDKDGKSSLLQIFQWVAASM